MFLDINVNKNRWTLINSSKPFGGGFLAGIFCFQWVLKYYWAFKISIRNTNIVESSKYHWEFKISLRVKNSLNTY